MEEDMRGKEEVISQSKTKQKDGLALIKLV